jgi:hypothetical protein
MYDDDCDDIATDIGLWESVALRLPLPEVSAMLAASQYDLAECLITFNEVYLSHPDPDESGLTLAQAIGGSPGGPPPRRSSPWPSRSARTWWRSTTDT